MDELLRSLAEKSVMLKKRMARSTSLIVEMAIFVCA